MDRARVEQRLAGLLTLLASRPRSLVGLAVALVLAGAVFGPAWLAVPCAVLLLGVLGGLAYLAWPVTGGPGRVVRLGAMAVLAVALALRVG